jgi:catechol 2,3-dioxygenase-like lactoylglutathione lyase family enzyme
MAVTTPPRYQRTALLRLCVVTQQLDSLTRFYCDAFGFHCAPSRYRRVTEMAGMQGIKGGVRGVMLELGQQCIELLEFDQAGRPYPSVGGANSPAFQHFAIVVADMAKAFGQLEKLHGWSPISDDGPEQLPDASGGVTAFKFRDPEGHPLELLAFPKDRVPSRWQRGADVGIALGIDHTAIVVTDTEASIAFYRTLGLRVAARTRNMGAAQARLDGLAAPDVDVIALDFSSANPHLELLRYRSPVRVGSAAINANDVAATRTVIATSAGPGDDREVRDPDGHRLIVTRMQPSIPA